VEVEYGTQFILPSGEKVRWHKGQRSVWSPSGVGMDGTEGCLRLPGAAFQRPEHRLLAPPSLDGRRGNVGLRWKHRPREVQRDHGIGGWDVQGLECFPSTVGKERAVLVKVFVKGCAVHRCQLFWAMVFRSSRANSSRASGISNRRQLLV
jgi:hypothetical protein